MLNPETIAINFLEDLGIESYPIDPFEICRSLKIDIFENSFDGLEGVLLYSGKKTAIGLNSQQKYYPRRKFSVAHELGHFNMDINLGEKKSFRCTKKMIESFDKSNDVELRADRFASELLIPTKFIKPIFLNQMPSWEIIKNGAEKFDVSMMSTAFKFINMTDCSCCLVISKNNAVQFYRPSKSFRYGLQMESRRLSDETFASQSIKGESIPDKFEILSADNWISGKAVTRDSEIYEWSLPLNSYGQVLTLLWDDETVEVEQDDFGDHRYIKSKDKNYSFDGVDDFPWEPPSFHKNKIR